jgi:hypothetical protein
MKFSALNAEIYIVSSSCTPSSGLLIILFQFVAFEANGRVAARPHI